MAEKKNRYINTAFWDDQYVSDLNTTAKLLFIYFLTNPLTNVSGIYQISLRRVAFDTGIDQESVKKMLDQFAIDKRIYFEIGWVVIKNWIKHQSVNPSIIKGIESHINQLPLWLRERLLEDNDSLCIDWDSLSIACDIKKVKESKRIEIKVKESNLNKDNPRNSDWYKKSVGSK